MQTGWHVVKGLLLSALLLGLAIWWLARWWKASDDRGALIWRWGLTLLALLFLMFVAVPVVLQGGYAGAFGGIPMVAVGGGILAIVWTRPLTESVGRRFGQLYDGGDVAAEPEPLYSVAEARRKQGRYAEAEAEVRRQLDLFPRDFRGHLLLAEIQADNLHDIDAARTTIERFVNQPEHAPRNVAFALTRLADWHLKHGKDAASARGCFERILTLCPDSPEAHFAHQRLARLADTEAIVGAAERTPLAVPKADPHLGVRSEYQPWHPPAPDPTAKAAALVAQLERFPMDNQAREDLALVYAQEMNRLDLATEQLEQLIAQVHAPERQVAHWLNLLADLQIKVGDDAAAARASVARIIERFPTTAAGEAARRRVSTINLEARSKKESQVVALGSRRDRKEENG